MNYLDFDVEIGADPGKQYFIRVLNSPGGETRESVPAPPDRLYQEKDLRALQLQLFGAGVRTGEAAEHEAKAKELGQALFDTLMRGEVRNCFDVSRSKAQSEAKGLRVKLRIQSAEVLSLPWELLYDARQDRYLALSKDTPLVRYLELGQPPQPLVVKPPLRILGMVSSPSDLGGLDVEEEKRRIREALAEVVRRKLVSFEWVKGAGWRDLQRALRRAPWHVFHFSGHGVFDQASGEGILAFTGEDGKSDPIRVSELGPLLAGHGSLRLVVLNSCEGARGDARDVFSGASAVLTRQGVPAVVAMQYEISDEGAIEFARAFYEAVADGTPVDSAMADARIAMSLAMADPIEWGTPALYMRAPDGVLFNMRKRRRKSRQPRAATPRPMPVVAPVSSEPGAGTVSRGLGAAVDRTSGSVIAVRNLPPGPVADLDSEADFAQWFIGWIKAFFDDAQILVDKGADQGVRIGDHFVVVSGKEKVMSKGEEVLGHLAEEGCLIKAVEAEPKFSICQLVEYPYEQHLARLPQVLEPLGEHGSIDLDRHLVAFAPVVKGQEVIGIPRDEQAERDAIEDLYGQTLSDTVADEAKRVYYQEMVRKSSNFLMNHSAGFYAPHVLFQKGFAQFKLERYEEAMETFQLFLDRYPFNVSARGARDWIKKAEAELVRARKQDED